jgi:phage replication initiation protein
MSIWTCALGWFRFTVPDSTTDEVMSRVGGEWIKDKKGFLGYSQGWLSRGNAGGLGRIGTGASCAPREVHVDLSQVLISAWTHQQFQAVATWVFEQKGHFGRIHVALDDRNGVIDVDRIYASVNEGNCVSHFRQSRLISGLAVGSGSDTGKTLCMGSRHSDTYLRIYDKAADSH